MTRLREPEPSGRSRVPGFLRANLGLIAVIAALTTSSTAAFSLTQAPVYESTAQVVVLPEIRPAGPEPQPPSVATEKQLMLSMLVAAPAARNVGMPAVDLLQAATVTVPVDTYVLQVTCTLPDPARAQQCAQELAEAYVAYKDSQPINTVPQRARVISPATFPEAPGGPSMTLKLAVGLLLGLVLGFIVAFIRDRLDDRVRGPADLEERGIAVLARIPEADGRTTGLDGAGSHSAGAEIYEVLGERTRFALREEEQCRSRRDPAATAPIIVVMGVGADTCAFSVAGNLAVALAAPNERLVAVNADTGSRPSGKPGLLDVLAGRLPLTAALRPSPVPGLTVLPLGDPPDGTAGRIGPAWTTTAMALARDFELVIVYAAPLLSAADGLRVADGASGLVVVVDEGSTTRTELDQFLAEAVRMQSAVLGCVCIRRSARNPLAFRSRRARTSSLSELGGIDGRPAGSDGDHRNASGNGANVLVHGKQGTDG